MENNIQNNEVDIYEKFEDMGLSDELLRGVFAYGYEKPSVIQQKAIKQIISGKDLIAQAQSGTGKTATFTIGMLQKLDVSQNKTQVIILAHTRELATQIHNVVTNLSKYMKVGPGRNAPVRNVICNKFVFGIKADSIKYMTCTNLPGQIC